jgi:uncharacterized protein YegP (UPF0339 family)
MTGPVILPYERDDGQWDWRLFGANGEKVCSSLQAFRDEADAVRGAETAKRLMIEAEIVRSSAP